jgi:hypothetical protein
MKHSDIADSQSRFKLFSGNPFLPFMLYDFQREVFAARISDKKGLRLSG